MPLTHGQYIPVFVLRFSNHGNHGNPESWPDELTLDLTHSRSREQLQPATDSPVMEVTMGNSDDTTVTMETIGFSQIN